MTKRGIIIANTGTPAAPTPEAVRSYLMSFLSDQRICPVNPLLWKFILRAFILPKRSPASAKKYQQIWTAQGSPLSFYMASLAHKLQEAWQARGEDAPVRCSMSYGAPTFGDALAELQHAGCDELVVMPLYPQSAHSTTLVVRDKLDQTLAELDWHPQIRFIDRYSDRSDYLDAIARSILAAGFVVGEDRLLFAFHSIPMKDIDAGDDYDQLVAESVKGIIDRLGLDEEMWAVGFQCRFDSRVWLGPSTEVALEALSSQKGRLFVVAPNFSIDCLETLYDIEIELKERFLTENPDVSADDFIYVPCLNDSDAQVALISSIVDQDGFASSTGSSASR